MNWKKKRKTRINGKLFVIYTSTDEIVDLRYLKYTICYLLKHIKNDNYSCMVCDCTTFKRTSFPFSNTALVFLYNMNDVSLARCHGLPHST